MRNAEHVDLSGRRMLVTGCSVGSLGFATAQQLAHWGATVIVTTRRDTKDLVKALNACCKPPGKVDGHPLDLSDSASVSQFTEWHDRYYGERLDVLINNAGIHLDLLSRWKEP